MTTRHNEREPNNDSNKRSTERQYLSETEKMTERMASGRMTVWRLDTGELKRFGKDAVKREATVQLGGDITKKGRNANRGERGLRGAKGKWHEENIISAVIHAVDETRLHLHCDFVPLTSGEFHGERR